MQPSKEGMEILLFNIATGAEYVSRYLGGNMVKSRAVSNTTNLSLQTLATLKEKGQLDCR